MSVRTKLFSVSFVLFFCMTIPLIAQTNEQKELEAKRERLQREIKNINNLLFKERKEKRSVLGQVEDLEKKISVRQQLIRVTNQQANLLNRQINSNLRKIGQLNDDLVSLKKDYAEMVRKSYKNKSQQSRLMFILSSDNFFQAYKRLQYIKQYTEYRKEQAQGIESKTLELQKLNSGLIDQRKEKERLVNENKKDRNSLEKERVAQKDLLKTIRKNENQYASQIRKKQKEAKAVERQINNLIRAAISRSNKRSGGDTRASKFSLTAEAKLVDQSFKANKGKLPWPVEKGVVILGFGTQQHPIVKSVSVQSNGVRIATEKGSEARTVFDGQVLAVQVVRGGNKVVLIQHGNYISVYNNLARVYVKEGDKVKTKQRIGQIFTTSGSGDTILKFSIYENSKVNNPSNWIYRM